MPNKMIKVVFLYSVENIITALNLIAAVCAVVRSITEPIQWNAGNTVKTCKFTGFAFCEKFEKYSIHKDEPGKLHITIT
jgi:hypothetical protein